MPSHRINFEAFMLEMQHQQVIANLQKISQDISEASMWCSMANMNCCLRLSGGQGSWWEDGPWEEWEEGAAWESQFFVCGSASGTATSWVNLTTFSTKSGEQAAARGADCIGKCSKETKRLCKEGSLNIYDLCTKQQQVGWMKHQGQVAVISKHKHSQA